MMKNLQTFFLNCFFCCLLCVVLILSSHLNNMGIIPAIDAPSKVCFIPLVLFQILFYSVDNKQN